MFLFYLNDCLIFIHMCTGNMLHIHVNPTLQVPTCTFHSVNFAVNCSFANLWISFKFRHSLVDLFESATYWSFEIKKKNLPYTDVIQSSSHLCWQIKLSFIPFHIKSIVNCRIGLWKKKPLGTYSKLIQNTSLKILLMNSYFVNWYQKLPQ